MAEPTALPFTLQAYPFSTAQPCLLAVLIGRVLEGSGHRQGQSCHFKGLIAEIRHRHFINTRRHVVRTLTRCPRLEDRTHPLFPADLCREGISLLFDLLR